MDPATESAVAHLKLAWWQEEMQRLTTRSAVHPISSYLAALPGAASADFTPLLIAARAAAAQISGVPLERGADLEPQSQALWGGPLALVSRLAGEVPEDADLGNCIRWLAAADYLARAIRDYRREASAGRVGFAIDDLMAAGIDNADLAADPAPTHLQLYLGRLRAQAAQYFERAARRRQAPAGAGGARTRAFATLPAAPAPQGLAPGVADGAPRPTMNSEPRMQLQKFTADPSLLAGRVILITGAGSGLGRALAVESARAGATCPTTCR